MSTSIFAGSSNKGLAILASSGSIIDFLSIWTSGNRSIIVGSTKQSNFVLKFVRNDSILRLMEYLTSVVHCITPLMARFLFYAVAVTYEPTLLLPNGIVNPDSTELCRCGELLLSRTYTYAVANSINLMELDLLLFANEMLLCLNPYAVFWQETILYCAVVDFFYCLKDWVSLLVDDSTLVSV